MPFRIHVWRSIDRYYDISENKESSRTTIMPILLLWATWMTANGSTSEVYAHPMTTAERTYLNRTKREQIHVKSRPNQIRNKKKEIDRLIRREDRRW